MTERWFIADLHLGHSKLLADRGFEKLKDMEEYLYVVWNSRVKRGDRVYVLGDVAFKRSALSFLKELNGKKVLVRGNHDIFALKDYLPYFEDVRGACKLPQDPFILTHIPVHPDELGTRYTMNIHGHLHRRRVKRSAMLTFSNELLTWNDHRYVCVSCEQTDYAPVNLETIRVKARNLVTRSSHCATQ